MPWPCARPNAREHEVGDARGRLDVARRDRRAGAGVQQAALRARAPRRPVGAGGRRDVGVGEHAHREQAGRARDRQRAVEVARVLRRAAGEVEHRAARPRRSARRRSSRSPSARLEHVLAVARAVAAARPGRRGCAARSSRAPRRSPRAGARRRAAPRARRGAARRRGWRRAARAGRRGARGLAHRSHDLLRSPPSSSGRGEITTPSSSSVRLSAGIEPGTRPPTSAWWARLAAKPISSPAAREHGRDDGDVRAGGCRRRTGR